jgi:hypothetical protein
MLLNVRKVPKMFSFKNTLNTVGLLLTLIGVWVVYVNSPVNYSAIGGRSITTDHSEIVRKVDRKNQLMEYGVWMVLAGTLFQLGSNYVPVRKREAKPEQQSGEVREIETNQKEPENAE